MTEAGVDAAPETESKDEGVYPESPLDNTASMEGAPTEAKAADTTNDFPDGGTKAWSAVVGGFCAQ